MTTHTCPRCGHQIPRDATPGAYPGALSRTDGPKVDVCSPCGNHEGHQARLGALTPRADWPVVVPEEFYVTASATAD